MTVTQTNSKFQIPLWLKLTMDAPDMNASCNPQTQDMHSHNYNLYSEHKGFCHLIQNMTNRLHHKN